jgi:osmoprotectant transport system permease protein
LLLPSTQSWCARKSVSRRGGTNLGVISETVAWLTDPAHWSGANGIPARLFEHVGISAVSLAIALVIALPVGLYIGHTRRGAALAVNVANLWRALPSLAVIAIVLPITAAIDPRAGFLVYPTVVAMVVLALPPILVNAYSGISGVDSDAVEAARGQGMSERQILTRVELPLAIPVIVTGIRSATVQVVATATLGAIFGFGGLGRYIVDGIAQFSRGGSAQMLGGVILVAGLVVLIDTGFALVQVAVTPRPLRRNRSAAPDSA